VTGAGRLNSATDPCEQGTPVLLRAPVKAVEMPSRALQRVDLLRDLKDQLVAMQTAVAAVKQSGAQLGVIRPPASALVFLFPSTHCVRLRALRGRLQADAVGLFVAGRGSRESAESAATGVLLAVKARCYRIVMRGTVKRP
jgi:hypothetical protein